MNQLSPPQIDATAPPVGFDIRRLGRFLLYTAIGTFSLAAVASIAVILFGDFGGTEGRILLSSFAIAAYSLVGLIATARYERSLFALAPLGLGSAGVGLVLTLILIWSGAEDDFFVRLTTSIMVITGALAHANLLLADPDRDDPAAPILAATLVLNAILTAMIVVPVLLNTLPDGGFYWKSVASVAVLLVLGTLVVPIVRKINDRDEQIFGEPGPLPTQLFSADTATLDIRYRGRAVHIRAESLGNDQAGFTAKCWMIGSPGRRPVAADPAIPPADDPQTALGLAVQAIIRAIDDGRL